MAKRLGGHRQCFETDLSLAFRHSDGFSWVRFNSLFLLVFTTTTVINIISSHWLFRYRYWANCLFQDRLARGDWRPVNWIGTFGDASGTQPFAARFPETNSQKTPERMPGPLRKLDRFKRWFQGTSKQDDLWLFRARAHASKVAGYNESERTAGRCCAKWCWRDMSGRIESKRTDAKLISRQKRHSDSEQRVKVSMRLYDRLEASLVLERERDPLWYCLCCNLFWCCCCIKLLNVDRCGEEVVTRSVDQGERTRALSELTSLWEVEVYIPPRK